MTESPSNLKVRVVMNPELTGGPSFWARYRWDRIVMALALVIGLALVLYGLFAPESELDETAMAPASSAEDAVADAREPVSAVAETTGPDGASINEPAITLPDSEPVSSAQFPGADTDEPRQGDLLDYAPPNRENGEPAGPEVAESATGEGAETAAPPIDVPFDEGDAEFDDGDAQAGRAAPPPPASRPASRAEPEPDVERVVEAAEPEASPVARSPVARPRDNSRSGAGPAGQPLTLLANEVISSQVSRFRLTDRIRRREPVGTIADIREDPQVEGLVRVIAFSSVRGMAGQQIVYRWRRGDQVFAEIPVRVGADTWRSYSSKYLSKDLRGRWRVDLVDGNGALLAYTEFDY